MTRATASLVIAGAYVGTIIAANLAVTHYGAVPVGFGLAAPAGVYCAGLAFTLRDVLQERSGLLGVVVAVLAGTIVSALFGSGAIATAAAVAFLLSELADLAVYTALRGRSFLGAVVASNVVGLVIDSLLFLALAFGSLAYLPGQIVGKAMMTIIAVPIVAVWRRGQAVHP